MAGVPAEDGGGFLWRLAGLIGAGGDPPPERWHAGGKGQDFPGRCRTVASPLAVPHRNTGVRSLAASRLKAAIRPVLSTHSCAWYQA
jgi:hypothetical protein